MSLQARIGVTDEERAVGAAAAGRRASSLPRAVDGLITDDLAGTVDYGRVVGSSARSSRAASTGSSSISPP